MNGYFSWMNGYFGWMNGYFTYFVDDFIDDFYYSFISGSFFFYNWLKFSILFCNYERFIYGFYMLDTYFYLWAVGLLPILERTLCLPVAGRGEFWARIRPNWYSISLMTEPKVVYICDRWTKRYYTSLL